MKSEQIYKSASNFCKSSIPGPKDQFFIDFYVLNIIWTLKIAAVNSFTNATRKGPKHCHNSSILIGCLHRTII